MMVTMQYKRILSISQELKSKSVLLLGPRRTGKSWLIRNSVQPDMTFNLLQADVLNQLARHPSSIREALVPGKKIIAIDEIQKLPFLMDEVHALIEERPDVRFFLTGSSARKLRRQGTSLMAGRARTRHLKPFVSAELEENWNLSERLHFGCLPPVVTSSDPWNELHDYAGDYLREEIVSEGLARNIDSFARFLSVAATCQGTIVNFEKVGNDCQVPPRTVREYFHILEDTLLASLLPSFQSAGKRKAISKAKFYLFDVGVYHSLIGQRELRDSTPAFGLALESLIFQEISAWLSYTRDPRPLSHWRTHTQNEVDFVIGDDTAIEVKATRFAVQSDLKGMRALSEETTLKRKIIVTRDTNERLIDDINIVPVEVFLKRLWSGEFV